METSPIKSTQQKSVAWSLLVGAAIFFYDVFKMVATVLGVAFLIRYFLIQPFYIQGNSMEPSFHNNQYIIVDQISRDFGDYKRGDVVVFRYPRNEAFQYIKRVIGLPGEEVEVRDGSVIIYNKENPGGITVAENYINSPTRPLGKSRFKVGDNEYFVMGDNRPHSADSREFGPVDRHFIIGRTWLVLYPFDQFQAIGRPVYGRGL